MGQTLSFARNAVGAAAAVTFVALGAEEPMLADHCQACELCSPEIFYEGVFCTQCAAFEIQAVAQCCGPFGEGFAYCYQTINGGEPGWAVACDGGGGGITDHPPTFCES